MFVCGFTGLALAAAELPPTIPPDSSQSLLVAGNIEGWTERCGKEKGKTEMRLEEGLLHFVFQCPEKRNKRH